MYIIWFVVGIAAIASASYLGWRFKPLAWVAAILVVGLAFAGNGVALASYPIAHHIAQRDAVSGYHQFLNGSLVSADVQTFACSENGPCSYEYDCDPWYETVYDTDKDGKVIGSHQVTHWNSCPYVSQEFTYTLTDAFGNTYTIADHIFAANPQPWKASDEEGIPGGVQRGVPHQWQDAHDKIAVGNAPPVTVPDTYDNYILASEDTLLKAASSDIARLKKAGLLPDHTANLADPIHGYYQADKISFVGFKPTDAQLWQDSLMHFNAALGMQKQGDLHVVAIKASLLPHGISPEDYLNALKAYWLNDLGKNAIAKNSIILVLGIDRNSNSIEWSRAATGMPIGNGEMLEALSNDISGGTPFSAATLFGNTTAKVVNTGDHPKVQYTVGTGLVPQIVMNIFPFKRACMGCEGKEDAGQQGFVYLSTEIPLVGFGIFLTILADLFILALLTGGAVFYFYSKETLPTKPSDGPYDRLDSLYRHRPRETSSFRW